MEGGEPSKLRRLVEWNLRRLRAHREHLEEKRWSSAAQQHAEAVTNGSPIPIPWPISD
jgi:hypothetical protein